MSLLERYAQQLATLGEQQLRRELIPAAGFDFTSNDYLALATDERVRRAVTEALARGVPIGSGGSRLLRGNHVEHEKLEVQAAAFFRAERALLFGSGYAANLALLSTLPQRGDLILHDALVHASAHDGMKLGRASSSGFAHNDPEAAARALQDWRAAGGSGTPWIVIESVYSMDGDRAPIADFVRLADRERAFLVIDEAHATGVFGDGGRGCSSGYEGRENLVVLHTGGKALGAHAALVTAPAVLCDFLVNRGRSFIFATAPSPLVAVALQESLRIIAEEPERRTRLAALVSHAERRMQRLAGFVPTGTHILPWIIGDSGRCRAFAKELQGCGFDVRAIRPPTVPAGTARLRIAITLNVDERAIDALVAAMQDIATRSESRA